MREEEVEQVQQIIFIISIHNFNNVMRYASINEPDSGIMNAQNILKLVQTNFQRSISDDQSKQIKDKNFCKLLFCALSDQLSSPTWQEKIHGSGHREIINFATNINPRKLTIKSEMNITISAFSQPLSISLSIIYPSLDVFLLSLCDMEEGQE